MTLGALALFALAGGAAGFLAGLFGIGGGAVLVPVLYVMLDAHFHGAGLTVIAHATSLAVIVPTAASALVRFHASSLVPWRVVGLMGSGAAAGALLTTRFVPRLPEMALRGGFALFLTAVGLRMLWRTRSGSGGDADAGGAEEGRAGETRGPAGSLRAVPAVLGGSSVGVVSAALGVGGGTLAIPLLLVGVGLDVRRVAAASMGVVACAALAGTAGYLVADAPGLPAGVVGWVYLPAFVGLVPGAVLGARWGAAVNTRVAPTRLRILFALLLLAIALRIFIQLPAQ